MVVQWLRLPASTAGGTGSIPGWGTKILHAARRGQKINLKKYYDVINVHIMSDSNIEMVRMCLGGKDNGFSLEFFSFYLCFLTYPQCIIFIL